MQWFARGRLWASREAERDDFQLRKRAAAIPRDQRADGESLDRRGSDWRPGGAHKDPRDRFKKKNRPERAWSEKDPPHSGSETSRDTATSLPLQPPARASRGARDPRVRRAAIDRRRSARALGPRARAEADGPVNPPPVRHRPIGHGRRSRLDRERSGSRGTANRRVRRRDPTDRGIPNRPALRHEATDRGRPSRLALRGDRTEPGTANPAGHPAVIGRRTPAGVRPLGPMKAGGATSPPAVPHLAIDRRMPAAARRLRGRAEAAGATSRAIRIASRSRRAGPGPVQPHSTTRGANDATMTRSRTDVRDGEPCCLADASRRSGGCR